MFSFPANAPDESRRRDLFADRTGRHPRRAEGELPLVAGRLFGGPWLSSDSRHAHIVQTSAVSWQIYWDDGLGDGDFNDLIVAVSLGARGPGLPMALFTFQWVGGNDEAFDATASFSQLSTIRTYIWNFGDGTSHTGADPRVTHRYSDEKADEKAYKAAKKAYKVELTVIDELGRTASAAQTVTVDPPYVYAPLVRLHEHEKYFPGDADVFIRNSQLFWRHAGTHDPYKPRDRKDPYCQDHPIANLNGIFASGAQLDEMRLGEFSADPYHHYGLVQGSCEHDPGKMFSADQFTRPGDHSPEKMNDLGEGFYLDLLPHNGVRYSSHNSA